MYAARLWSVRNAGLLDRFYRVFSGVLVRLHPLFRRIGYGRLERLAVAIERPIKGFLFDCRMCGLCVLGETGMSCPMNCPKSLRNGPCGGVREDGHCEVEPAMRCVWVAAWEGSRRMSGGASIGKVQAPVDHLLAGSSSWLRVTREAGEAARATQQATPGQAA
jgi:hypothetical protein